MTEMSEYPNSLQVSSDKFSSGEKSINQETPANLVIIKKHCISSENMADTDTNEVLSDEMKVISCECTAEVRNDQIKDQHDPKKDLIPAKECEVQVKCFV